MLGPSLLCMLAIVFLSATVRKATDNKAGTVTIITSIIETTKGVSNIYVLVQIIIFHMTYKINKAFAQKYKMNQINNLKEKGIY